MNEINFIELYYKRVPKEERVLEYKICSRNCSRNYSCYECAGSGGYSIAIPNNKITKPLLTEEQFTSISGTIEKINRINRLLNDKENIVLLKHYQTLLEHPRTDKSIILLKRIK